MKTISASVGRYATNAKPDVTTVQELLNGVFPENGGPEPLLDVDGLCGPKTTGAIQRSTNSMGARFAARVLWRNNRRHRDTCDAAIRRIGS